ncbi:hypothetical protein ACFY1B_00515 [Streptomyces mirabilis]|uniref:hypothetical protein n=1 Tax=Streptomyces mirabilis TaxID=68239 RepID=UPI0036A7B8FA
MTGQADRTRPSNKVHADFACSNGTGNWVCIGQCHGDEESTTGRWVFRDYLTG